MISLLAAAAVSVQFAAFAPSQVDALPGDTVAWTNQSPRAHTVTADAGAFGSAELGPGAQFAWTAGAVGSYGYHCTIHPAMTGEIDVRRVTLAPLPPAVIPAGTRVTLIGRAADASAPVRVERTLDGSRYVRVTDAAPDPAGNWSASVVATQSADFRAASGADVSGSRRLLVSDRRVIVRLRHGRVDVTVQPSLPNARVVLQRHLRERFGWWPVKRKRLDFVSRTSFRARTGRMRVALVDRDGWTPLALSRAVIYRRAA
jgi:hypothetical protein